MSELFCRCVAKLSEDRLDVLRQHVIIVRLTLEPYIQKYLSYLSDWMIYGPVDGIFGFPIVRMT